MFRHATPQKHSKTLYQSPLGIEELRNAAQMPLMANCRTAVLDCSTSKLPRGAQGKGNSPLRGKESTKIPTQLPRGAYPTVCLRFVTKRTHLREERCTISLKREMGRRQTSVKRQLKKIPRPSTQSVGIDSIRSDHHGRSQPAENTPCFLLSHEDQSSTYT